MTASLSPIQIPVTNGFVRSIANTRLEIAGLSLPGGFAEVMRKRTRNRERVYSNNVDPVGDTDGQNEYEASCQLYFDWYVNLIATIRNNYGAGYGSIPFNVYLTYVGVNVPVYFDVLEGCKFDSDEINAQKGTSPLINNVNLRPLKIYFAIPDGANYKDPLYDDNPDPLDTMT
jgi:hypothetical protein